MTCYSPLTDTLDFVQLKDSQFIDSPCEKTSSRAVDDADEQRSVAEKHLSESIISPSTLESDRSFDVNVMPANIKAPTSLDDVLEHLTGDSSVFPELELSELITDEYSFSTRSNVTSLPVTRSSSKKASKSSINLSDQVAVIDSNSNQIQLVYPIENTYRPRYKSDYFHQNGSIRHPRYIADSKGNHCIRLKLPNAFDYGASDHYVRVALLTKWFDKRGHYYSPYNFQTDHNGLDRPDENPIYIKVDANGKQDSIVKLQLVLIKSKLSELKASQPLRSFCDSGAQVHNIIGEKVVSPKELINQYQLDQSHLAFTLCTKTSDGTYRVHPDTTTISSLITEVTASKKTGEASTADESSSADSKQYLTCPCCAQRFDPDARLRTEPSQELESSTETTTKTRRIKRIKVA